MNDLIPSVGAGVAPTILVTGASGSIGSRLVDRLVKDGHSPHVAGRHPDALTARWPQLAAAELDVMRSETLAPALDGVDVAYYLVHSMEPGQDGGFRERDAQGALRPVPGPRAGRSADRDRHAGGGSFDRR